MSPKNDPQLPFVSSFLPIDAFMETKGNQSGNEIVSSLKSESFQRRGHSKMETRILEPLETKHPKNGPLRFLPFPSRQGQRYPTPGKESIPLKEFLGEFLSSTVSACVNQFENKVTSKHQQKGQK